jgi:hypothetical protein
MKEGRKEGSSVSDGHAVLGSCSRLHVCPPPHLEPQEVGLAIRAGDLDELIDTSDGRDVIWDERLELGFKLNILQTSMTVHT